MESTRLNLILPGRLLVDSPAAEIDPSEGAGSTIDLTSHWEEDREDWCDEDNEDEDNS